MNDNSSRRVIADVGMHRSGTSCLTGSLQQIGLELGQVHTWNRYNRRGNREQQDIVDLNDEVMAANGGAWDQPPAQCHWTSEQLAKARELVSALGDGPVVGFKDPRTLITLDGWLQAIPELEFVGAFRHPDAVAASLAVRSAMPRDQALALWRGYNRRLWSLWRRRRFPLVDFDLDADAYLRCVTRVAQELQLDPQGMTASFFDQGLRTSQAESGSTALPYADKLLHWRLGRRARRWQ